MPQSVYNLFTFSISKQHIDLALQPLAIALPPDSISTHCGLSNSTGKECSCILNKLLTYLKSGFFLTNFDKPLTN